MKRRHLSKPTNAIRAIAGACLAAAFAAAPDASAAPAATVAASLSQDGTAFTAAFANHASETNSLFVVYDASDKGAGTNGWAHVERLGTVTPETDSWTYPAPAGWGDSVKALRFVLSEVPYDYDYSLDFIRNADYKQRIVLSDFDLYMNYRVCVRMRTVSFLDGHPAVFSNRDTGGNVAPSFTLFAIRGSKWRFDYNDKSGSEQGTVKTENCDYAIEASSAGLYVNGTLVESKTGTTTDIASKGRLEFFCGNTTASTMGNMNLRFNLYGAQVYDAPAGGNLLVNLVPMVKDGVAGMYDTVRDKFYFSDIVINDTAYPFPIVENTRVESANPFFASALVAVAEEGPTVFSPASSTTDATDYANPDGGILNGSATLTLSGDNDWGGKFAVSNGTLAAAFGQGLAATDALLLAPAGTLRSGTYGGYAGYAGRATAPLGTGSTPGAVNVALGGYWAFAAPDGGSLELDAGGEGAPIAISSDYRRFLFNGAAGAGTLTVANPLVSDGTPFNTLVIRTGFGKAELAGNVTGADAANPANGLTIDCYDLDTPSAGCDGRTVFLGSGNHFKTLQIRSGTHGFGEGAAATLDGNLNLIRRHVLRDERDGRAFRRGRLHFRPGGDDRRGGRRRRVLHRRALRRRSRIHRRRQCRRGLPGGALDRRRIHPGRQNQLQVVRFDDRERQRRFRSGHVRRKRQGPDDEPQFLPPQHLPERRRRRAGRQLRHQRHGRAGNGTLLAERRHSDRGVRQAGRGFGQSLRSCRLVRLRRRHARHAFQRQDAVLPGLFRNVGDPGAG